MQQRSQKQNRAISNKNLESVNNKIDKLAANFEKDDEKAKNEAFLELHALTKKIESNNRYRGLLSDTWGKFADGYEKLFKNPLNKKLPKQSSEQFAEYHYIASINKIRIEGLRWGNESAVEDAMHCFATLMDYPMLRIVAIKDILEKYKNQPLSDQEILVYENAIFDLANDYAAKNNKLLAHKYYLLLADKGEIHKAKAQQRVDELMNDRGLVKPILLFSEKEDKFLNNTALADQKNSNSQQQKHPMNISAFFHGLSDTGNHVEFVACNEVEISSARMIELPVWKGARSRSGSSG